MVSDWISCPPLQSREMVKRLLGRNNEVLSASARDAMCSVGQLKLAMEKYMVLTEKERETMTAEESRLFMLLRSGCSCGGSCECGGTCSGECGKCSGNCNCGNGGEN